MPSLHLRLYWFLGLLLVLVTCPVAAEDWPQHLGPTQDAVSSETNLLDTWPADGPPVLWRHDMGIGFAGAAVVDGEVFVLDREPSRADVLRVFDLESGKELWSYRYDAPGRVNFPGTRSTPSVTDTHVYITGTLGHIHAINRQTHQPDWSYNIYDEYPDDNKMFGFGMSPLIVEGLLLLSPTAQDAPIVIAVKPETGKVVWQSRAKLETMHTFHTPLVRTIAGKTGITCRDRTHLYFIDIKTGRTLWSHKAYDAVSGPHVTITPVTVLPTDDENRSLVFVTNGYENGSVMLDVQRRSPTRFRITEKYRIADGGQVHPALHHEGHFYLNINENANLQGRNPDGGLVCIDATTGQVKWQTRNNPNLNRGATLLVDGKLIAFDANSGELLLINPTPDRFDVISKFKLLEPVGRKNNAWSPLVISDGRLIIRDQQAIACIDLRSDKAE